jgi:hypothetical protein
MTSCCFFVSLSSLCFATDEDGCAVENFCNTLFKCRYFVIIILYCKTIHPVIFFQQHTFFIVYILLYNTILNRFSLIIEYWFFSDVEHFFPGIAPPVNSKKKITPRILMISVFLFRKKTYSKIKVYCKKKSVIFIEIFFKGFQIF